MIPNSPIQKQGKDKESCVKSTQFNRESDIFLTHRIHNRKFDLLICIPNAVTIAFQSVRTSIH